MQKKLGSSTLSNEALRAKSSLDNYVHSSCVDTMPDMPRMQPNTRLADASDEHQHNIMKHHENQDAPTSGNDHE